MGNTINIAYLYPDILNLHGDRGNILAFERIAKMMNLDVQVDRIDSPSQTIDFEKYDIMILSPGELKVMKTVRDAFSKQAEELEKYIESGRYLFAVGTTQSVFASDVKRDEEEDFSGLGILDGTVRERKMIYGDDLIFECEIAGEKMEIASCQINSVDISYNDETEPFGRITYGYGNDRTGTEGARKNNLILTNALGPVFIKNPWLTEAVLKDAALRQGTAPEYEKPDYSLEEESLKAIKAFADMKDPV